jgi:LacI family transcriptional regulator
VKKKTTIYDIAAKLKITAATVSRALNDSELISRKTKKMVLEAAHELSYYKNRHALALKSGRTNQIGLVVPFINRHFFSNIIMGVEEELYPKGYQVMIFQSNESEKKEQDIIEALLQNQVDGVLVSVSKTTRSKDHFNKIVENNLPLIFFDRRAEIDNSSCVETDDVLGGKIATQHLIDQGCSQIAYVTVDLNLNIYINRFKGYKETLKHNGIDFNADFVFQANSDIASGRKVARQILSSAANIDAIFCSSDYIALGVMQELKENNIDIPGDVAVVGFSNEPFTELLDLTLTSIEQNPYEMGKSAARVFLDQVNSKDAIIEHAVKLKPKLCIRDSSLKNAQKTN